MECNPRGGITVKFPSEADIRNLVTVGVSVVPEVGQVLSGVIKVLWKDNTADVLFNQMKEYVDKLIPGLIAEERMHNIELKLKGLHNVLNNYQKEKSRLIKGGHLTDLIDLLDEIEPEILDAQNPKEGQPERVLAYFVAFGTLKLVALRERYLHSAEYFGDDAGRDTHLTDLKDAVKSYTDAAAVIRQRIMDWRRSFLNKYQENVWNSPGPASALGVGGDTVYYVSDNLCGWTSPKTIEEWKREPAYQARWADVQAAYGADLDRILSPLAEWKKLGEVP